MRLLSRAFDRLLDVLAPPSCAACDGECPPSGPFCLDCGSPVPADALARLLFSVPLTVAGVYSPPLSTAIQRFKYQGRAELCVPLARLLSPAIAQLSLPFDALFVPVPLHARRLAARGYNQAGLLATELASQSGRGCRPRLLARARDTERQVGKHRAERLENLRAAFQIRQATSRSVVLVDDVITTGSTVRECAQALASESVKVVAIVALARAYPD